MERRRTVNPPWVVIIRVDVTPHVTFPGRGMFRSTSALNVTLV
jgi:hypothetical protein